MQQEANNAKQLIVERIRQSTNILVAVSVNPSVDALSAALALSLLLNKMDKHATAVFSGQIPPAIQFLEPGKTFENTVDGLRDFIISLDKEKADRLRYKVEDDVVKIFITPYRTVITEKDLQFSQGELNVELVIALGVDKQEDLDKAIMAHGRILHDATVVTLNASNQRSSLGSIDLHDPNASSLCEMLISLSESFQKPGLIDAQISTALLTGVVAATERFSNDHTSPKVMTMAAQLMASGANQQLIATSLGQPQPIPETSQAIQEQPQQTQTNAQPAEQPKKDGELDITHDKKKEKFAKKASDKPQQPAPKQSAEDALAAALPVAAAPNAALDELKNAIESEPVLPPQPAATPVAPAAPAESPAPAKIKPLKPPLPPVESNSKQESESKSQKPQSAKQEDNEYLSSHSSWKGKRLEPPSMGGSLSATAQQALEDKLKADEQQRNQTLLSHADEESVEEPVAAMPAPTAPPLPPLPPLPAAEPEPTSAPQLLPPPPLAPAEPAAPETPIMPELPSPPPIPASGAPADIDAARQAVSDALASPRDQTPDQQAPIIEPPLPPAPVPENLGQPAADLAQPSLPPAPAPMPPLGPMPDATGLPPLPPMPPLPTQNDVPMPPAPEISPLAAPPAPGPEQPRAPAEPTDPGQFKIPM